jgi:hypothetical protein
MGLIASSQLARAARPILRGVWGCVFAVSLCLEFGGSSLASGQSISTMPAVTMPEVSSRASDAQAATASHTVRARRFLGGRAAMGNVTSARAMEAARRQHAAMLAQQAASPLSSLSAPWQPIGPNQIASVAYGNVTGRITAIAIDPADPTGNTVYLGTTGGGVWK